MLGMVISAMDICCTEIFMLFTFENTKFRLMYVTFAVEPPENRMPIYIPTPDASLITSLVRWCMMFKNNSRFEKYHANLPVVKWWGAPSTQTIHVQS